MPFPRTRHCRILLVIASLTAAASYPLLPHFNSATLASGVCATSRPGNSDSEEQSMLSLVNDYRTHNGAPPVSPSPVLAQAALWKSADMALYHYFAHDDLIRGWQQRIADCGYGSMNDAENLAGGHPDAQTIFEQWRTSAPHNANLLNPAMRAIGVGRAQSAGGDWYWTADLGASADTSSAAQPGAGSSSTNGGGSSQGGASTAASQTSASARGAIAVGHTALVNTPNDCLRAHTAPSLSAPAPVCIPDGSSVQIVDGPTNADGQTWWSIPGSRWVSGNFLNPGP